MHAVLTSQVTDILHFNDNIPKASYFLISTYGKVVGFELSCERSFAKVFN